MAIFKTIYNFLVNTYLKIVYKMPFSAKLIYFTDFILSIFYDITAYNNALRNKKKPTTQMLNSQSFFNRNTERVNKNIDNFIDNESKETYKKMIDFRCYSIIDDFPVSKRNDVYFRNEYIKFGNDEILIDCGAYIGDTIKLFKKVIKHFNGSVKKIVAFEPHVENFKILRKEHKEIIAINTGVWDSDTKLTFFSKGTGTVSTFSNEDSIMEEGDNNIISVKSIDNCPECEGVTILKMDIEGSELKALIGAKNTIEKYKPRLAICIYHSDEDMIQIPEWIHENFPEYKLFVRHYLKYRYAETVLYGFVDK